jgi:transporter family-2 protein
MRSISYLLGLAAGLGLTVQVGMNSQLRRVLQSANTAALISFLVGTIGLMALLLATRSPLPERATLAAAACWARFTSPARPSSPRSSVPPAFWG